MLANWDRYAAQASTTAPWAFWPWDASTPDENANSTLSVFAYCITLAARNKDRLSLLDWGGALGNYGLIARSAVPQVVFDYTVKDRPSICAAGRQINSMATFVDNDDVAFARRYDFVLASNALQYAEDWRGMVRRLAGAAEQWLAILQTPVIIAHPSFVVVQRPQRYGLGADYISWAFNRTELLAEVAASGMKIEREFLGSGKIEPFGAPEVLHHMSFLFRRS